MRTAVNDNRYSEKHFGIFFAVFALSLLFLNLGLAASLAWLETVSATVCAGVLVVAAAIVYFVGKKHKPARWLNPVFNSLASGLFISVYYLNTGKPVDIAAVAIMQAVMLALFALTFWFLKIERFNRIMLFVNLLAGVATVIVSIVLWDKETTFYQQMLFTALFYIAFVLGQLLYSTKKHGPWFCFAVVYFTTLSIVLFIVMLILSEGDGVGEIFAGLAGGVDGGGSRKKKKGRIKLK